MIAADRHGFPARFSATTFSMSQQKSTLPADGCRASAEHLLPLAAALQCTACLELLFEPLCLPCGFAVCARCLRPPVTHTLTAASNTSQSAASAAIGAYVCPAKPCRKRHRFRSERHDVLLAAAVERILPQEASALRLAKAGEQRLRKYWNPEQQMCRDGSCMPSDPHADSPADLSPDASKSADLDDIVRSCFTPAIDACPHLQLPYILRAKALAELGQFDAAAEDARIAATLNPLNRRGLITEKLVAWRQRMYASQLHLLATCAVSALYGSSRCESSSSSSQTNASTLSLQSAINELRTEIQKAARAPSFVVPATIHPLGPTPILSFSDPRADALVPQSLRQLADRLARRLSEVLALRAISPSQSSATAHSSALARVVPPALATLAAVADQLFPASELECHLCLSTVVAPLTTPCGHTWCRQCLVRSLDHSRQCPMCRTKLPQIGYFVRRPTNRSIEALTKTIIFASKVVRNTQSRLGMLPPSPPPTQSQAIPPDSQDVSMQDVSASSPTSTLSPMTTLAPAAFVAATTDSSKFPPQEDVDSNLISQAEAAFNAVLAEASAAETTDALDVQPFGAPEKIPIFICSLVFPGLTTSLHMFEPRYRVMMKRCIETNRRFGIVLPAPPSQMSNSGRSTPTHPQLPCMEYGTLVHIQHFEPLLSCDIVPTVDGNLPRYLIEAVGLHRFRVISTKQNDADYLEGYVERVEDVEPEDEPLVLAMTNPSANASTNVAVAAANADELGASSMHLCPAIAAAAASVSSSSLLPQRPQTPLPTTHLQTQVRDEATHSRSPSPSSQVQYDWDPSMLANLVFRARSFVTNLLSSLPPAARLHFERRHGRMPDDPADLSYWLAEFLPLSPYMLYTLLPLSSVTQRMKVLCEWIDQTTVQQQQQLSTHV